MPHTSARQVVRCTMEERLRPPPRVEDSVEWDGEGREGVLTPALTGVLTWAASSLRAAVTAIESDAVKESAPSGSDLYRMSIKNVNKTQILLIFSNTPQQVTFTICFCGSVLPPHLGCAGIAPHGRPGGADALGEASQEEAIAAANVLRTRDQDRAQFPDDGPASAASRPRSPHKP
jgi:hypothetical protein